MLRIPRAAGGLLRRARTTCGPLRPPLTHPRLLTAAVNRAATAVPGPAPLPRPAMAETKRRRVDADASTANGGSGPPDGVELGHQKGSTFRVNGLVVTNHTIKAPLDYSGNLPGEITVFVRELVSPANARRVLPPLLYLQGGPGFEAPRPTEASGWVKYAANNFRIFLLDQRGTGLSSPISVRNLQKVGDAKEQAEYLACFRADSIVRDAERVRAALLKGEGGTRWSILGQSFGGFCALSYLSLAPAGLSEVMLTGGIPPNVHESCSADATYRALYRRVLEQNRRYYARFPEDAQLVQRIVRFLDSQPGGGAQLPSGTRLTPRAFQLLGLSGLGSSGGFERLHYILEGFFEPDGGMSPGFVRSFESAMPWEANPLYALLHEPIYCQGAPSNWSAHRLRKQEFADEFDAVARANAGEVVNFTGEMVYPWMFEDFAALRPYKEPADLLAAKDDWGPLYSTKVLTACQVPVAAAVYLEDMYVDYNLSQATAAHMGRLRQWVTNEYKHSGIRDDGHHILDRLLSMVRDTLPLE